MVKLSAVLATFNEEKNIKRCLSSVKDITDEIVLVDGGSKDKTVEIAKEFGAKIKITDNPKNFHINKQKAIGLASNEWILQLDADEVVSPELKQEIESRIKSHEPSDVNGYWIPRKNWFLGRFLMKGGQYPDYTLRLYRKGKGRLPQKDVHEQAEVEGNTGYLKASLLHYPYSNFSEYLLKWNRYAGFLAGQISFDLKQRNIFVRIMYGLGYMFLKPTYWFFASYLRHKGFMDSWQGLVFSLFSALRFPVGYLKYKLHTS